LVYFWLLPAYIAWYYIIPKVAGGKLYSSLAARLAFIMFIIFSVPVGLHHQYADPGITNIYKAVHAFFTFMVAVPSLITAFTVAASLEYAGRQRGGNGLFGWWLKLPWGNYFFAYAIAGMIAFIFGGIILTKLSVTHLGYLGTFILLWVPRSSLPSWVYHYIS